MSGQTTIPNYRETLFTYPDLSPIHGEPTYESLKLMTNQLKANARAVRTPLGGGQHGYLGLLISPEQYAIISTTPFLHPTHPGPLVIPAFQLPHVVTATQSQHSEALRLYNEYNNVGQALRQQIVRAVDESYLLPLHNRQTNTILVPIFQVIRFLFVNHGKVTPSKLMEEELQVKSYVYIPAQPIDVLFNKIEDLLDLSVAAQSDYTVQQLINIAYVIINKTGKFGEFIRKWNHSTIVKNWNNFKIFFRDAHADLRETGDLEIQHTQFNSANLVQEVIEGVQRAMEPAVGQAAEAEEQVMSHMANAASQNQMMPQMLQQMVTMMEQMQTMQREMNNNNNSNHNNNNYNNNQNNNRNGRSSNQNNNANRSETRGRTNTSMYCWSHGACAHSGQNCNSKKEGHKDAATLANKMGGSTAYCT